MTWPETCDELAASWQSTSSVTARSEHLNKIGPVYGLAAHAFYLSARVTSFLREGDIVFGVPLLRGMLEAAVHAQWLVRIEGATEAFLAEAGRQQLAMAKSIREARFSLSADVAEAIESAWPAREVSKLFAEDGEDLRRPAAAGGLYVQYRLLSALSHAGPTVAGRYIQFQSDGQISALSNAPTS